MAGKIFDDDNNAFGGDIVDHGVRSRVIFDSSSPDRRADAVRYIPKMRPELVRKENF
ncbi:hypothetical protein G6016_04305 [Dietzia aerolata]|uniref:Uncharacterized protein n=1 Tax=Dietzia aerolata TaxID=595984 RepID=A0ABV5JNK8_9ACTN|nr:hypothetical protein [Dietzia aerolata]MBB0968197.1 hypothetical protein [Dietzia aerolata]